MVGPILAGMLTVGYGGASACYYMAGRHYEAFKNKKKYTSVFGKLRNQRREVI